jgi:hypothetical protein
MQHTIPTRSLIKDNLGYEKFLGQELPNINHASQPPPWLHAESGELHLGLCEPHASSAPPKATSKALCQRFAGIWASIQHHQLCYSLKIKEILKQNFN